MIQINLLPGTTKKRAGAGFQMPDFKALAASVKDPLLLGVVVAFLASGAFVTANWFAITREEGQLTALLELARTRAAEYDTLLARRARLEERRVEVEAALEGVRSIDSDRFVWAHILSEVSRALPDFTWIVSLDNLTQTVQPMPDGTEPPPPPVRFSLEGRTADIQAYTSFVRVLESSPWLTNIIPGATQTVVEDDRQVTAFSIEGSFVQADSVFMQTAPVIQVSR